MIQLSDIPQDDWIGQTVLHPFTQSGKSAEWVGDGGLEYDLGIVLEFAPDPDRYKFDGSMAVTFLCNHGLILRYPAQFLWIRSKKK